MRSIPKVSSLCGWMAEARVSRSLWDSCSTCLRIDSNVELVDLAVIFSAVWGWVKRKVAAGGLEPPTKGL